MDKKAPKLMDKWQIGLIISFGVFEIVKTYFLIQEYMFAALHFEELKNGTIEIPVSIAAPYTVFMFLSLAALAWVAIRFITYRQRKRDYLLEVE